MPILFNIKFIKFIYDFSVSLRPHIILFIFHIIKKINIFLPSSVLTTLYDFLLTIFVFHFLRIFFSF